MLTSPRVMQFQTGFKVFCKTSIKSFLISLGLQNVNIIELHPPTLISFGATVFALCKFGSKLACRDVASECLTAIRIPPSVNSEAKSGGVPRRSFEMPDTIARLRLNGFGAAYFTSLYVRSEVWWRRRESNKVFPRN